MIALDLAKSVFQAHGINANGETELVKRPHRMKMLPFFFKLPPCLIWVEAYTTTHHWARTLTELGHGVRLMPPYHVTNEERATLWMWRQSARRTSVRRCVSFR